jgi:hypothetical protein
MGLAKKLLSTGAVATGMTLVLPALPAAAGPAASGRILAEVEHIDETFSEDDFCGIDGLTVEIHDDIVFRSFFTFRGADSIPHFHGTTHQTTTVTEPDGTTVTYSGSTVEKDQRIEVDGDLLTITGMGAGGFRVVGPEGAVRGPGMIRYQFVVDSNGTLQDPTDDEQVEGSFVVLRESTGLNENMGFCEDYLAVTGRTA